MCVCGDLHFEEMGTTWRAMIHETRVDSKLNRALVVLHEAVRSDIESPHKECAMLSTFLFSEQHSSRVRGAQRLLLYPTAANNVSTLLCLI